MFGNLNPEHPLCLLGHNNIIGLGEGLFITAVNPLGTRVLQCKVNEDAIKLNSVNAMLMDYNGSMKTDTTVPYVPPWQTMEKSNKFKLNGGECG